MIYVCVICMVKRPPLTPLSPEHRALLEAIVSPVINTEELKDWLWMHCAGCQILMQSIYNFQDTALKGVKNLKYLFSELNKAVNIAAGANPKVVRTTYKPETLMTVPLTIEIEREENLEIPFKIEPELEVQVPSLKKETIGATGASIVDPLTEGLEVKYEPESHSEPDPEPECDSESTLSCESDHDESSPPANTIISAPSTVTVTSLPTNTIRVISAPSTVKVRVIPKLPPEPVKSDEKFEVFTHGKRPSPHPIPSRHPGPYLTSIRWKGGVGDGKRIRTRKKQKPVIVPCPHCSKSMDKFYLKHHIARMHAKETCQCDVCGKKCRNQTVLKGHKANVHNEHRDPAAFCAQCNVQFRDLKQYTKHMQTTKKHASESDFRYKCDGCDRKFVTQKALQKHSSVHTDVVYPCDQCEQTFKTKSGRRVHIMNKHEGREYPRDKLCDYCGRGFTNKQLLASHMNTHTGARPFVCKLCGADFGHKSALYLHGRYKHKIQKKKKSDGKKVTKDNEKECSEKVNNEEGDSVKDDKINK